MKKVIRCSECNCNITWVVGLEKQELDGEYFCKMCWNLESEPVEVVEKECTCLGGCDWCLGVEPRIGRD